MQAGAVKRHKQIMNYFVLYVFAESGNALENLLILKPSLKKVKFKAKEIQS